MILPEAQLYGRNVKEKPVHRDNILETQVMEITRYHMRPRGIVAKSVLGKMFTRYLTIYSRNTGAWGKYSRKHSLWG